MQELQEDRFNLFETAGTENNFTLFTPVTGVITQRYSPSENHFAVDVSVPEKTPVKSVSDGTVILAEWTSETGYVVIIKHQQNLISVYKHNESLAVNQGDLVLSGEVISFAGSTGTLSTGPHLHLELWSDGYPINPTELINSNKMSLRKLIAKQLAKRARKNKYWSSKPIETHQKY